MTLWQCNNCKTTAKQNEYNNNVQSEIEGWASFVWNKGTRKKADLIEVHLCTACLKKVMQFLGTEW